MKASKIILLVSVIIIALTFIVPFCIFLVLNNYFLTPNKLTEMVQNEINNNTNLDFSCKTVELEYLSSWPKISLSIKDGELSIGDNNSDSISSIDVKFKKVFSTTDLSDIIIEKKLNLSTITVESPKIDIIINKNKPQIILNRKNIKKSGNTIQLNINKLLVNNGVIKVKDNITKNDLSFNNTNVILDGIVNSSNGDFTLFTECKNVEVRNKNFNNDFNFTVNCKCLTPNKYNDIKIKEAELLINNIPFEISGEISDLQHKKETFANVSFKMKIPKLKDFIDYIPSQYSKFKDEYSIDGETLLEGKLYGKTYDTIPDLFIKAQISNGKVCYKPKMSVIDNIKMNAIFNYSNNPDSCYIELKDLSMSGLNSEIKMHNKITNFDNPFVSGELVGNIDFSKIGKEFLSSNVIDVEGDFLSNISYAFNLNDLKKELYNKIWIDGNIKSDKIYANAKQYDLNIYSSNFNLNIGYKTNKSNFIDNKEVLSGTINIDTLLIDYKNNININISKSFIRTNTAMSFDNKDAVPPVTIHLNCNEISSKIKDNTLINGKNLEAHIGTKERKNKNSAKEGALVINAKELKYADLKNKNILAIKNGNFITEFHDNNTQKSSNSKQSSSISNYAIKGMINYKEAFIFAKSFPQTIKSNNARLTFKNNEIVLNRVELNSEKSDCVLTGIIYTSKDQLNKSQINGSLRLISNNMNYNELYNTYIDGSSNSNENNEEINMLIKNYNNIFNNKSNTKTQKPESTQKKHPIYIPKNLNLDINLSVNNMDYNDINLQNANGNIIIKDQKAYGDIGTRTNLGKINLEILYNSQNKNNVNSIFDLKINDLLVGQISQVLPSISTIQPLIKSMDGLINSHITAECSLLPNMLPDLSTARAVCTIDGHNITLRNDKVFAEVSKKLRLKNREKNIINSISMNIVVQDKQIMVVPFTLEWDRYKTIIGGQHSTDLVFDYHVDVLKSPIPIDFGLNIHGAVDNLKFNIKKCKYKDLYNRDNGLKFLNNTYSKMELLRKEISKKINL